MKSIDKVDKEINMNGNVYILKSEFEKIKKESQEKFNIIKPHVSSDEIKGICHAELKGNWFKSRFSIKEFITLIKAFKLINENEEYFNLIMCDKQPLMIGNVDKEKQRATGLVLAPCDDEE